MDESYTNVNVTSKNAGHKIGSANIVFEQMTNFRVLCLSIIYRQNWQSRTFFSFRRAGGFSSTY